MSSWDWRAPATAQGDTVGCTDTWAVCQPSRLASNALSPAGLSLTPMYVCMDICAFPGCSVVPCLCPQQVRASLPGTFSLWLIKHCGSASYLPESIHGPLSSRVARAHFEYQIPETVYLVANKYSSIIIKNIYIVGLNKLYVSRIISLYKFKI